MCEAIVGEKEVNQIGRAVVIVVVVVVIVIVLLCSSIVVHTVNE